MNGSEDAPQVISLVDLLNRLVPASEPDLIPLVPQTAGWTVLAVLLLLGLALLGWRFFRRYRANAYRRAALAELDEAGNDPAAMAELLRRTALAAYSRTEVASLNGPAWLAFLDESLGGSGFRSGPGHVLADAPYRPVTHAPPGLQDLTRRWIRHHRVAVLP